MGFWVLFGEILYVKKLNLAYFIVSSHGPESYILAVVCNDAFTCEFAFFVEKV